VRELGEELRNHRQAAGFSGQLLADRLGWSASKVSRIENGVLGVTEVDLVRYAACCGLSAKEIDALLTLHREPGTRLLALETDQGVALPREHGQLLGQLRTAGGARATPDRELRSRVDQPGPAVVCAHADGTSTGAAEPVVRVLHPRAGSVAAGGWGQRDERTTAQVGPARPAAEDHDPRGAGRTGSVFGGSFVLFRYGGHDPLLYLEEPHFQIFIEEEEHVVRYGESVATLAERALSPARSREMLVALASRFDHPGASSTEQRLVEEPVRRSG
jgi:transcriptional regulator with XRE-family HTH domain